MGARIRAWVGAESLTLMQESSVTDREDSTRGKRAPTSRTVAFDVLCRALQQVEFANRSLDFALKQVQLSDAERRLATELVYGVIRCENTLDAILSAFVARGRDSVEPELWVLLRMGAYQLVFLDSIPPHAAVYETVSLAVSAGKPRWRGFANGVLRAISRSITEESVTAPAKNAVPLSGGSYRCFDRGIFSDPQNQLTEYFSEAFGFGGWPSARWHAKFGSDELLRLGFWFNAPPSVTYLRTNLLKTTREALLGELQAAGVSASAGSLPESIQLEGSVRVTELPGFDQGWFSVQDESAMAAARLLDPKPGDRVWDVCAAPGGKTVHLAEIMGDEGTVLATDIESYRLARVTETRDRGGLKSIETQLIDPEGTDLPFGPFDAILLDAPCSNTGVLGKRPEARQRVNAHNIQELQALQIRLLDAAIDRLATGGRLVYSTCSIEPEENQAVVEAALVGRDSLRLVEEKTHIPGRPADGGFQALIVSTAD